MKYSKNPKLAKDFLRGCTARSNFDKWFQVCDGYCVGSTTFWETAPLWTTIDKPMKVFRTAARNTRMFGYAGPPSAKSTEVYSKYIVVDMFAKAVQGMKPEDAVKWADGELKKIYEARTGSGSREKPIAGGSGAWPASQVALPHPRTTRPTGWTRFLESERLLASLLLAPTILLLGVFIAYPFVMGVWLSPRPPHVGNPGVFVGPQELRQGLERLHLPTRLPEHVLLHVLGDDLQARPRHVAGPAPQPPLPRQAHRAGVHAAALHHPHRALHLRLALDVRPDLQRAQLGPLPVGLHRHQAALPVQRRLGHVVRHRGEHLARHALLRHHPPGRAADHHPRPARGGLPRRGQRLAALLARHVAPAQAGDASWWWSSRSSRPSPTSSSSTC